MEAWLKRELGKAEREAQLMAHKAHFVVMVAHLKYVNDTLGGSYGSSSATEVTQTLLAQALSVVPPAHMTAAGEFGLLHLLYDAVDLLQKRRLTYFLPYNL